MRSHQIIIVAAVVALAPIARADEAGALKQQGVKAAQEKNWELARELFQKSYALDPRPLTLYNLAVAQEHSDKLTAARASYSEFLDQPATPDTERFRKLAKDAIPNLDKAIPTLQIRAAGLATGDVIELDGHPIDPAATAPIPLDPGSHTIVVRRGRESISQRAIALARTDRADGELTVPAPPLIPAHVSPPPEPPLQQLVVQTPPPARESHSVLRSGWFWGVTAAVAVAAGASYYYLNPSNRDPTKGTLGPGMLQVP